MPSDKPERVEKWRNPVSGVQTLTADKFAEMVIESGLRVVGPYQGCVYAALETDDGYDMYRAVAVDWDSISKTTAVTADPAAGTDLAAITVPAGKRWLLLGMTVSLVTSADVANRYYRLSITDGTNTIERHAETIAHTASLTVQHTFKAGGPTSTVGLLALTTLVTGFGDAIVMEAGWTAQLTLTGLQAADNMGPMYYFYKEIDA